MSGGFIKPQKKGGHQVIIFTLVGEFSKQDAEDWNKEMQLLKKRFAIPRLVAVTLQGDPTPPSKR